MRHSFFSERSIELIVAIVLILCAGASAYPYVERMAVTSLWSDEMRTIKLFSSQGPLQVITDYHLPNNHIFFNLINSLSPYSDSYDTLRARLWSFIAVFAAFIVVLVAWFRTGRFLEAAVFTQVCLANHDLLDIVLQARGYGFLFLFAVVSSLAAFRFVRDGEIRMYGVIGACTFFGAWTIPLYLFFGGTLMAILFLFRPNRTAFIAGAVTLLAIVVVHLPVAEQMLGASRGYAAKWGLSYPNFGAVVQTFHAYLPVGLKPTTGWMTLLILFGPVVILALDPRRDAQRYTTLHVVLAIIAFLFACLIMQTPPVRTTAFVMGPLAIAWLGLLSGYYRSLRPSAVRFPIMAGLVVFFIWSNVLTVKSMNFKPIENWLGAAEAVHRLLPDTMGVHLNHHQWYLKRYLDPETSQEPVFNEPKFAAGKQAHVDADFLSQKPRFRSARFTPTGVDLLVPQREWRGGMIAVSYAAPDRSNLEEILVNEIAADVVPATDRKAGTGVPICPGATKCVKAKITVVPTKGCRCRSVTFLFEHLDPRKTGIEAWAETPEGERIAKSPIFSGPRSIAVALDDRPVSHLTLLLGDLRLDNGPPKLVEAWAYCSKPSSRSNTDAP